MPPIPETIAPFLAADVILFALFGLGAVSTAILLVLHPNPMRAALFLVLNLISVAVLYLLLHAWFLAAVQVLVYTGAIMVLFLFVIMLLNLGTPDRSVDRLRLQQPLAVLAGLIFAGIVGWTVLLGVQVPAGIVRDDRLGSVEAIGVSLFSAEQPWLFAVQAAGVLLLIAVIGAVVLARRRPQEE